MINNRTLSNLIPLFVRVSIVVVLLLASFIFHNTAPAQAATFTVTNLNNSGPGSLRQAILDANGAAGADIINFSVSGTIILASTLPNITSDITINGGGTIAVDGGGAVRVFFVASGGSLTLDNITVQNGSAIGATGTPAGQGGGIFNDDGGTLTVQSGTQVINNTASGTGGGIFNNGGTIMVSGVGTAVSTNITSSAGGGISSYYSTGVVTIQNGAVVSDNTASNGGGIYNWAGTVTITGPGTAVSNNLAGSTIGENGGGIYNDVGTLTIQNGAVVSGNTAPSDGGGIYNWAGTVTITGPGTAVSGNTASSGGGIFHSTNTLTVGAGTVISSNTAKFGGGGIFNDAGTLAVTGAVISGNAVTGFGSLANYGSGGGIFNHAGTLTVDSTTISNNTITGDGGGIFNRFAGSVTVTNSRITDNSTAWYSNNTTNTDSITGSCIINNGNTAVTDIGGVVMTATGNWWGATNGPGPVGSGGGDTISTNVDASGFLSAPILGCPTVSVTLSGTVYRDDNNNGTQDGVEPGIGGVTIDLAGTDIFGLAITQTTTTAANGSYSFEVSAGTYTLTETQPVGYDDGLDTLGSLGGTLGNDVISAISATTPGDAGTDYNFGESIPNFSIDDVTLAEGNSGTTAFTFTVTLSSVNAAAVTVDYATANGTATTADSDYAATSGTLTFAPGILTQSVTVNVTGDLTVEADETFTVDLSNATVVTIADAQGVGTITNDDSPALSIDDVTLAEGDAGATAFDFTVTLSAPSTLPVTVDYTTMNGPATTADNDYVATSGTLTFAPGVLTQTVTVNVTGDVKVEANETFTVDLSNATVAIIADNQGVGTITNDDSISLSIDDVTLAEGNAGPTNFDFTVTLSAPSALPVTVDYATADNSATIADSDYASTSGTLTIPAGSPSGTITVPVTGDLTVEADETFTVDLSNPTVATIADNQGLGTINNDDNTDLSIDDITLAEGNSGTTAFTFTVTLSAPSAFPVAVDYATTDGSATTTDSDYVATSGTLTFAPGILTQSVTVNVTGDLTVEADETFTVDLSNPTVATIADDQGLGTITNDDSTDLSIDDVTLAEGDAGATAFDFTVTLSAPSTLPVTVDYTTMNGPATTTDNDYVATSGTLTFAPGVLTQTVTVNVTGDVKVEANETFTVDLSNATVAIIADNQGVGTITNDDSISLSIDDVTLAEGDAGPTTFTFTVSLSAPSAFPVAVDYATTDGSATIADNDYAATNGILNFAAGVLTQTVTVPVTGDITVEANETFTVDLSNPTVATIADNQGLGTITNDDNAPISGTDTYTAQKDGTLIVDAATGVLANDSDPDSDPMTAVLDIGPTNGTLTFNADGSFTYVPDPGFAGTDSFTYHATDGIFDGPSMTVTITVALPSQTSAPSVFHLDIGPETALKINPLGNSSGPNNNQLKLIDYSQPAHGQVMLVNGKLVYTSAPGFAGSDSFTYTLSDGSGEILVVTVYVEVWLPLPHCADFDMSTNDIVYADIPNNTIASGDIFCRVLVENSVFVRESAEIGIPEVLNRGVIQAVDAFALFHDGTPTAFFNNPVTVCLQGSGTFLYLDATVAPRSVIEMPVFMQNGYTCANIPNAGTVVLVNGAASVVNPAPAPAAPSGPTTPLSDCMVTTHNILNLRDAPSASGAVLRMVPYDVTLTAFERTSSWFYVDYLGERGWLSAGYVTPQGTCGP